ncbi:FliC/FljB family flagellin [Klebsiella aerogenes]|uniref:FliC/FljB family flagellin n=1 Tax=Klebsiella aerogenes TaxID=548 RepID=UPI001140C292|nr:FliC/FljB family flagellin [Klebsiella aerogenes]EKV3453936.1 FliC/FljB family flagellin [Klebsiella aerogenes]ELA1946405.1 FliC/FljB family flagellin [Klebsiella aerogenes]ELT6136360.1 FliC/FljB family flagellin [Klebsiella aerogenes]MBF9785123.1 FliC/FljB family flagellin [Klebsiella aerogenes]MBF9798647.1 FliC/FljB family flagellin [Klebsiella aerogenes]
MAQVINTNSLSLMAQNNLNKSQSSLGTAIERLSSGLRINSAKDDAAGQAISNRFTANIKGLTQASRNANDGISLAQTTEGALNEVNDNLQNIRRLTVQSQNGSNSASDLQSIQDEISQRLSEINRISEQTDFNGVKVLSGDQKLTIQVGANDGETIDIDLKDINAKTLGLDKFSVADGIDTSKVGGAVTTIATGKDLTITNTTNQQANGAAPASYLKDNTTGDIYAVGTDGKNYKATIDKTTGDVTNIAAAETTGLTDTSATTTVGEEVTATGDTTGLKSYDGGKSYVIQEGTGADAKYFKATADSTGKVTKGAEMSTTPKTADPLATLDKALSQVDQLRSSLGAVQNRFDSVINNLNSTVNNLSASQSRIQDADYATEVSNMSRANILQQAGTSVLAQANQSTQNVLSLLR